MRILIVATEAPPIRSGIAQVIHALTSGLTSLGHSVDVVTASQVGRWQAGEMRLTALATHWPRLQRRFAGFDVVNLHGPAPSFSEIFLMLWRAFYRRPHTQPALVYTHHSEISLTRVPRLCAAYNRAHWRLARVADRVTVSTESYRQMAADNGIRGAMVVPLGVPAPADDVGLRNHPFTVACIGQLRPYKGVDTLLRTAQLVPDVRFEIAGSGHQEPRLRQLAASLQLRNVNFHGPVSDTVRDGILQQSHVIALPSVTRAEAFGLVLLEGMSKGAVPIASDLPGVRDVAKKSGLLCTAGDAESFAEAIRALRDDPSLWHVLSVKSRVVASEYPWNRMVTAYERMYLELSLERHSRGPAAISPA